MYHWFLGHTHWRESQLSAGYISIDGFPHVVTHCAPCCIVANLNSTLSIIHTTTKPNITICTSYKGTQWECKNHAIILSQFLNQWNAVMCADIKKQLSGVWDSLRSQAISYSDRWLQHLQNDNSYGCQLHCWSSSLVDFQYQSSAHRQAR